jgi:alkaline phosphatase
MNENLTNFSVARGPEPVHLRPMSESHDQPTLDRRGFLGLGVAGALAAGAGAGVGAPAIAREGRAKRGVATNIIMLVSDGMSFGTLQLADAHLHRTTGRHSNWRTLWERGDVRRSIMQTYSADGFVTDSAAAGTAWGSGEHVNNGAVNVTPDGRKLTPILLRARATGKGTGLVTTTRMTHATPATLVANVTKRAQEDEIAKQQLARKVDVLLGGGAKHFSKELISSHTDYSHTTDARALRSGDDRRLLGLFNDNHLSYELDRVNDPSISEPSLAELTEVALGRLSKSANGFFLQVEGGRVDHAAHANDAASLIVDQIAFDKALAVALRFAEHRNDTLVIVTTDHGNANPGLTIYGKNGAKAFEKIGLTRYSFDWLFGRLWKIEGDDARKKAAPDLIEEATGITLTKDELAIFGEALDGVDVDPFGPANGPLLVLGSLLANHHGVAFLSPNHTADFVELTSFGPGSELIAPVIDNIELNTVMIDALDLAPASLPS